MAQKILIVDDDLETVKLIGIILERRGYEITAAQSGEQALAKACAENPDLMILDVMMPDIDGYEVSERLRAIPATSDLPIIMFTAKAQVDDKVAGFKAGADDYLTKPVHPDELVSRVEAVLLRCARRRAEGRAPVPSRVIGFLGAKGGVGTTTLAVNVAVALAQGPANGQRVVLAEIRPGLAASGFQMGLHRGQIARLLEEPADRVDSTLVEAQLEEHSSGVLVLTGQPEPPGVAAPVSPAHAEAIVQHLSAVADYLLLDLGVGLEDVNRRVLLGCYHVVVTTEPQRASLALVRTLLAEMGGPLNLAGHRISVVLINRAPSANSFSKEMAEGLLQQDVAGLIPPAVELAFQSAEQGVPMVTVQPASLAAEQFRDFAEYLASV